MAEEAPPGMGYNWNLEDQEVGAVSQDEDEWLRTTEKPAQVSANNNLGSVFE